MLCDDTWPNYRRGDAKEGVREIMKVDSQPIWGYLLNRSFLFAITIYQDIQDSCICVDSMEGWEMVKLFYSTHGLLSSIPYNIKCAISFLQPTCVAMWTSQLLYILDGCLL